MATKYPTDRCKATLNAGKLHHAVRVVYELVGTLEKKVGGVGGAAAATGYVARLTTAR